MGTTRSTKQITKFDNKKGLHAQQATTKSFAMEIITISKKVVERRVTNLKKERGLK
jgi:hypothetical protein